MSSEEEQQQQPILEPKEPPKPFHLDLHAWIEAQQTAHGVRHDDYGQYHAYCTRRLSRLSHLPEAKKYLVCSSKFATEKTQKGGGRHAYCSRQTDTFAFATPNDDDNDNGDDSSSQQQKEIMIPHVNVLWYLLVLAERAWAHANQLQKQKKKRQQVLRKLKKAQGWAQLLLKLAQEDRTDATTYHECQAYASWMTANYALEKLDYQTASQEYAKAMTLCHQLSSRQVGVGDDDDAKRLERQDLYLTRADTVLRPLFRYCQYELKQAGQEDVMVDEPRLTTTTTKTSEKEDETSITFRGRELVLDSKELRVLLLKYQSLKDDEEETKQHDETSFLTALSVLDDALEVIQASLRSLEQAQAGPAVQAKRQHLNLWKGYLRTQKTQRVMDHTSELLRTITGHAERVHVYESLLQMAKSLLLELVTNDPQQQQEEEEEDEFALQVQANILRLRALKTYHMAWYYYQQPRKYQKALSLVQQSQKLSKRAQEELAACDEDMPHADAYLQELEQLPIPSAQAAMQAALYLQQGGGKSRRRGEPTARSTNRPLLLRLQDEDAGMVLADEDLLPMPIPCKPVFYDLAYDYATDSTQGIATIQSFLNKHTLQSEPEDDDDDANKGGGSSFMGWLTGSK